MRLYSSPLSQSQIKPNPGNTLRAQKSFQPFASPSIAMPVTSGSLSASLHETAHQELKQHEATIMNSLLEPIKGAFNSLRVKFRTYENFLQSIPSEHRDYIKARPRY